MIFVECSKSYINIRHYLFLYAVPLLSFVTGFEQDQMQSTALIVNSLKDRLLKDKKLINDLLEPREEQIESSQTVGQVIEIVDQAPPSFGPVDIDQKPQQERFSVKQSPPSTMNGVNEVKEQFFEESYEQQNEQGKSNPLQIVKQALANNNVIEDLLSENEKESSQKKSTAQDKKKAKSKFKPMGKHKKQIRKAPKKQLDEKSFSSVSFTKSKRDLKNNKKVSVPNNSSFSKNKRKKQVGKIKKPIARIRGAQIVPQKELKRTQMVSSRSRSHKQMVSEKKKESEKKMSLTNKTQPSKSLSKKQKKISGKKQEKNTKAKQPMVEFVQVPTKKVSKPAAHPKQKGANILKQLKSSQSLINGNRRNGSRIRMGVKAKPLTFVVDVPVTQRQRAKLNDHKQIDSIDVNKKRKNKTPDSARSLKANLKQPPQAKKPEIKEKKPKKTKWTKVDFEVLVEIQKYEKPKSPSSNRSFLKKGTHREVNQDKSFLKKSVHRDVSQDKSFLKKKVPKQVREQKSFLKRRAPKQVGQDKSFLKKKVHQQANQENSVAQTNHVRQMKGEEVQEDLANINLGSTSLFELVKILNSQGLVSRTLFSKFSQNHSTSNTVDFLEKFTSGKLDQFNFSEINFTLLDHRRISELVSNLCPQKYYIGKISASDSNINTFLKSLYELSAKKYFELYKTVDGVSQLTWWNNILDKNKNIISKAVEKGKNSNQIAGLNETISSVRSSRALRKSAVPA